MSKLVELDHERHALVSVMRSAFGPILKRVRAGKRLNEKQHRALANEAVRLKLTLPALIAEARAAANTDAVLASWLARLERDERERSAQT